MTDRTRTHPPIPSRTPRRHSKAWRIQFSQRMVLGRAAAERILMLADFLEPDDRGLLRAVFSDGLTPTAVAQLAGQAPHLVQRRLLRLLNRLESPEFLLVAGQASTWPPRRAEVGQLCCLHGRSMRDASNRLRISVHAVRQELAAIRLLAAASPRAPAAARWSSPPPAHVRRSA